MPTVADYPDLVAQWDRTRNRPLKPDQISYGSARKVWWRCDEGRDHRWMASPNARTSGENCPFCAGKRVSVTNSLATCAPELVAEFHRAKNRPLTPETTHSGTNRKMWWRCKEGHEWQAVVSSRVHRFLGCPMCSHRRVTLANSLAVLAPAAAAEWHPTKNGSLLPRDLLAQSNRKVWWKCPEGADHEWMATPGERTASPSGRTACPFCVNRRLSKTNTLARRFPKVAAQWHPTKNGKLTPRDVTYSSMKRAFWRCSRGHEWSTRIHQRTQVGTGCPYCGGRYVTPERSLARRFPEVAAGWHPKKNGKLTPHDVMPRTTRHVWWKCPVADDHEWEGQVANRVSMGPDGCPFCSGRRLSRTNMLALQNPKVAREWHPTRNGKLTPRDVTWGTGRRVWWRCVSGHEWQAKVCDRAKLGRGCPTCRRRKRPVATTGRGRRPVHLASYAGPHHGPVRRVR